MSSERRRVIRLFVLAAISIAVAVVTGVDRLGQPLRLVHLLTILGLGMSAGVTWTQAVARLKANREARSISRAP